MRRDNLIGKSSGYPHCGMPQGRVRDLGRVPARPTGAQQRRPRSEPGRIHGVPSGRSAGAARSLPSRFYGTAHFVVTAAVLVALFRWRPREYRRARTALAATTICALVGFALFPLAPPRLFPSGYGFVDSLQVIGGRVAVGPLVERRWLRVVAWIYPLVTLVTIVATANHYVTTPLAAQPRWRWV